MRRVGVAIAIVVTVVTASGCSTAQVQAWFAVYRGELISATDATTIATAINADIAPGCDDNYVFGCVPNNVVDVDCGRSGDGPAFIWGPLGVSGWDHFGLDPDGDRLACEPPAAPPLGTIVTHEATAPNWGRGGDPFVMREATNYYVFGSNTNMRLPVAVVDDLATTYTEQGFVAASVEGMPAKAAWATDEVLWAPTVVRVADRYVLWFAANRPDAPDPANRQCIGRAFAASPTGPYLPEPTPFSCGIDGVRGALDPDVFMDPHGDLWLYAAFSGTHAPIHVIPLDPNGDPVSRRSNGEADYVAAPVVARTHPWEGRFIENPAMTYDASTDTYLMAYSAGDWWTAGYSTGLARCASPVGMCTTSATGPWLAAGEDRTGSGGLSFFTAADGSLKAAYATFAAGDEGTDRARFFTTADVDLGTRPTITP